MLKRDFLSYLNNQCCCHMNIMEYRNRWFLIHEAKCYLIWIVNLSKFVTNNLLFNKSLKIQDSCLLGPLIPSIKIARITFLAISNPRVLLQTWQNKFILALIYIFITAEYNKSSIWWYLAALRPFWKCRRWKMQTNEIRIFRNSTSVYNRFIIFTEMNVWERQKHVPISNIYSYNKSGRYKLI